MSETKKYNFIYQNLIGHKSAYLILKNGTWDLKKGRLTKEMILKHIDISNDYSIGTVPLFAKWRVLYCKYIAINLNLPADLQDEKSKIIDMLAHLYHHSEKYFHVQNDALLMLWTGRGFHIIIFLDETTYNNAQTYLNFIKPQLEYYFKDFKLDFIPEEFTSEVPTSEMNNQVIYEELHKDKYTFKGLRIPFGKNTLSNQKSEVLFGVYEKIKPAEIKQLCSEIRLQVSKLRQSKFPTELPENRKDSKDYREKIRENHGLSFYYTHANFHLCLKKIIDGTIQADGINGEVMKYTLINFLYHYGATIPVIIKAFENQKGFDFDSVLQMVNNSIAHINYSGNPCTTTCKKIKDIGFCLPGCSQAGFATSNPEEMEEQYPSVEGWRGLYSAIEQRVIGPPGRYEILKTTRSGTTSVVIIKALQHNLKVLMIAPLVNIFEKTVFDAIEIGMENGMLNKRFKHEYYEKIHRVQSNFEVCTRLNNQFKDVEDIESIFPFFFKGYCRDCDSKTKANCLYQDFITFLEHNKLIYLTVKKFNALVKGGKDSQIILNRLMKWADIIFVDECSHIFDAEWSNLTIWQDDGVSIDDRLKKWRDSLANFCIKYPSWLNSDVVLDLELFIKRIREHIEEMKTYHKAHFISFENKLSDHLNIFSKIGFYQQLLQYFKETKDASVRHLVDCFLNMNRRTIYLQLIVPLRRPKKIILASVNDINSMVEYLNKHTKDKILFLTDATQCPIELSKCFDDLDYIYINDPLDTASKQFIYMTDKGSSFFKKNLSLKDDIIKVLDKYANNKQDPVFLVTQSKEIMKYVMKIALERGLQLHKNWEIKRIDYFRGKHTTGQPSKLRRMIVLGTPRPPRHCYDFVADIYQKGGYLQEFRDPFEAGKYLENYSSQSAFFQAISRVKDPFGKEYSSVFIFGPSEQEVDSWLKMKISTPQIIKS